jgi:hypothetical protein
LASTVLVPTLTSKSSQSTPAVVIGISISKLSNLTELFHLDGFKINLAKVKSESESNTVFLTVATSSDTVTDPFSTNFILTVFLSAVPAFAPSLSSPSNESLKF